MRIERAKTNKFQRFALLFLLFGFVLGGSLLYLNKNNPADAADANQFKAGNIISDYVFYNYNTMSASDIQLFLNSKVSNCEDGYTCLKDYSDVTVSKTADSYCSGYSASSSQTSAQMIYGVAQSCKVNPQVLIVLLQKEMGLVTHNGPGSWRYKTAAGFACPDSGTCDSQYYGLFNQLYSAARQYQRYRLNASSYNYVAGRNNNIQWNPNSSCGSGAVYIENQATAGLYNYTPYQPNQAALNSGYGTGDSCSSYGNRNFYLYFTDWFGSTRLSLSSNSYIADGDYIIASDVSSSAVLDIDGNNTTDGTNAQIWSRYDSDAQKFRITNTYDGFYRIKHIASGKYLGVSSTLDNKGANVQIWSDNNSCTQKWLLRQNNMNGYSLLSACSGLALDVNGAISSNGTNVQVWDRNNSSAQRWFIVSLGQPPIQDDTYILSAKSDQNVALDVTGGGIAPIGTNVQIWSRNDSGAQRFEIKRIIDGSYTIKNIASGRYVDVKNASTLDGSNVQIWDENGSCAQRWYAEPISDGYNLLSACSGRALDISGGNIEAGTNVQIWKRNSSDAQKWSFNQYIEPTQQIADGNYILLSGVGTNKALDVAGGGPAPNGTGVQIWSRNDSGAQRFEIKHLYDAIYTIKNIASGRYVDVKNASTLDGSNVQIWDENGSCAQRWKVARVGTQYIFLSTCSSKALDVNKASTASGTGVQIWNRNSSDAQKWELIKLQD